MSSILDELNQEIDRRIAIIESPDYDKGPPLNKVDYIAILITAIVAFIIMVAGY
jgi:hypothetical protein